jgi:hypothetical protein
MAWGLANVPIVQANQKETVLPPGECHRPSSFMPEGTGAPVFMYRSTLASLVIYPLWLLSPPIIQAASCGSDWRPPRPV